MELESTRIFVKVVQLGSFSKAALSLKLPKSTVSRTITRLEAESGTKLLLRTTRSMTLTPAGRHFYEDCVQPLRVLEEARQALQGKDTSLTGTIRLTAPEDVGVRVISPVIGKIATEFPGIFFELNYTDEVLDLVQEGYDLAIRIGKLNPSQFKIKKIGEIILVPVASPAYLKKKPVILKPQDLSTHDCMTFDDRSSHPTWVLGSSEKTVSIQVQPRITVNQMSGLVNLAVQGVGVALVPCYLCKSELQAKRLVRVLPEWTGDSLSISIVSPLGLSSASRLRLVSDRLSKAIQAELELNL